MKGNLDISVYTDEFHTTIEAPNHGPDTANEALINDIILTSSFLSLLGEVFKNYFNGGGHSDKERSQSDRSHVISNAPFSSQ